VKESNFFGDFAVVKRQFLFEIVRTRRGNTKENEQRTILNANLGKFMMIAFLLKTQPTGPRRFSAFS
jgi:hypothetical protein